MHLNAQPFKLIQHTMRTADQHLSGIGGLKPPVAALDQRHAQSRLNVGNASADGRCCNILLLCYGTDGAQLHYLHEEAQRFWVNVHTKFQ